MASEQNHPWCSNVQRDEAIRATEDAAAAEREPLPDHRDLPAAVAELRERVGRLEAANVFSLASSDIVRDQIDGVVRRVRGMADAEAVTNPRPEPTTGSGLVTPQREAAVVSREGVTFTENGVFREAKTPSGAVNPAADASGGEGDGLRKAPLAMPSKKWLERMIAGEEKGDCTVGAPVPPADGLRTERVTLEVTIRDGRQFGPQLDGVCGVVADYIGISHKRGESVRVVDYADAASDEAIAHGATLNALAEARKSLAAANRGIDRLTAERDAANEEAERATTLAKGLEEKRAYFRKSRDDARAECERRLTMCESMKRERDAAQFNVSCLKARVAELERAYSAECDARAQAQRELSDLNDAIRARESGEERDSSYAALCREAAAARERADSMMPAKLAPAANAGGEQPHPPRGWLTEEERKAVEAAVAVVDQRGRTNIGVALDALLARSTPPRVRRPRPKVIPGGTVMELIDHINEAWIAAIREAGGEVAQ